MMTFVKAPNLPKGKISHVICGTEDRYILDFFKENDICVIKNMPNHHIDNAVSTHADMAALHVDENIIIVDKAQDKLKITLSELGFEVYETTNEIKGMYPDDIRLNFTVTDSFIAGNFKYADEQLLKLLHKQNRITVKQGYCKCSTLVVSENAVITDDESIEHSLSVCGIDSLLISKGDILLDGHEYGFIGGASGKISHNTVVFFGDIKKHRDYKKICEFLIKHGCSYVCTDNGQLRDIGGIVPLTVKV